MDIFANLRPDHLDEIYVIVPGGEVFFAQYCDYNDDEDTAYVVKMDGSDDEVFVANILDATWEPAYV